MQLTLTVLFSFITLGLVSRTFGPRQQVIIALVAVMLMLVQFTFSRFLCSNTAWLSARRLRTQFVFCPSMATR